MLTFFTNYWQAVERTICKTNELLITLYPYWTRTSWGWIFYQPPKTVESLHGDVQTVRYRSESTCWYFRLYRNIWKKEHPTTNLVPLVTRSSFHSHFFSGPYPTQREVVSPYIHWMYICLWDVYYSLLLLCVVWDKCDWLFVPLYASMRVCLMCICIPCRLIIFKIWCVTDSLETKIVATFNSETSQSVIHRT